MRKPGCLRFLCVRCLRARVGRLRFVRAGRPLLPRVPALTHLACPRALAWALLCLRGGGSLGLLWACLLAGGWVSCLRAGRVRLGVCVLACVRSLGGGGAVWSRRPLCPGLLACLRAHALVWACWRVRGSACPMGGWRSGRGGTIVSRPFTCVGGAVHRPMRGEEGEKGWG